MYNENNKKRVLFTTDAKLSVKFKQAKKFDAAAGAPADSAAADQGDGWGATLVGYPIVWNTLSDDRGGYRVRLLPGSARFTPSAFCLFHHDFRLILACTDNQTLRIIPDEIGVRIEADVADTQAGRDAVTLVEKKYVQGMSFSMLFDPPPEFTMKTEDGIEIQEVSLFTSDECSITGVPSFTATTIGLQDEDDEDEAGDAPTNLASNRIEQSIRLEQLRLSNLQI